MDQSILIRDTNVTLLDVLRLLAKGHIYEQILKTYPVLTLADILGAIQVAASLVEQRVTADGAIRIEGAIKVLARNSQLVDLTRVRETSPRAYEKWETAEDNRLAALYKERRTTGEIASTLGRQEGAVIVRLKRLGLMH